MLRTKARLSILSIALLIVFAIVVSACSDKGQKVEGASSQSATSAPIIDMPSADSTRAIAQANNTFAVDLWKRVGKSTGNLTISPASISAALVMTWGGAKGVTAQQMGKVLHLPGDAKPAGEQWGRLSQTLQNPARPFTIRIANRLFGEKTFAFKRPFLEWTNTAFGAALEPLDFKDAADASRTHINTWIDVHTEHRIRNLLPPDAIDTKTRLVLVNAIYFLADWQRPFYTEGTLKEPFFVSPSQKVDVSTMHAEQDFDAAEIDGAKLIELDYKGGDVAMMIVLPNKVDGLAGVEKTLTVAKIDGWRRALAHKPDVIVALPRFEIGLDKPLLLRDVLAALGMPDAFDWEKADLTGIANPPNPIDRISLSKVIHKAFVKVDEKGTEAAAAATVSGVAAAADEPLPPFEFRADHPFLFFIIDKPSGLILFMGRVNDPSST